MEILNPPSRPIRPMLFQHLCRIVRPLALSYGFKASHFGRQIKATVLETLERLGVENAQVTVVDKGALDCTLKARVECAVFRSCGQSQANIPWGGAVR